MGGFFAAVLAAGKGVRMKSDLPKVLHSVCGRPMVRLVAEAAAGLRPDRILVVVPQDCAGIERALAGLPGVEFVVQDRPLGTGDALRKILDRGGIQGTLMVLPGDTPLLRTESLAGFLAFHSGSGAGISVLTFTPRSPGKYGRIKRGGDGGIEAIVEAGDAGPGELGISEVNSGIYCMDAAAARAMCRDLTAGNSQGEFYLTDLIALMRRAGKGAAALRSPSPEECEGVNTRMELADACRAMSRRTALQLMEGGVTFADPENTFVECGVEVGRDTVILPYSCIKSGVVVGERCRIGPFAHLREGTVLGDGVEVGAFTEVKATTMAPGSRAMHLAYLGDAAIGSDVNIGAGTITANFDGKAKHRTVIGDRCSVGSGTIFVAPVAAGEDSVTGAGAVVTRDVPPGATVAGVPARLLLKNREERSKP